MLAELGLEPRTFALLARRSNQLSYTAVLLNNLLNFKKYARPTILRSLVRTPARTIPRISQLEIHSVYQAVISTGFTWQCGGITSVRRAADLIFTCQARCDRFDSRCFPHIWDCMDNYSCLLD